MAVQSALSQRQRWIDVAKGGVIIAVVLGHVENKHIERSSWPFANAALRVGDTIVDALTPLRVPLFFAISGLLATRVLRRRWPTLLRGRTADLAYLFILWMLVQASVYNVTVNFDGALPLRATVQQSWEGPGAAWYLYALAFMFPLAKAGIRFPSLTLALSIILCVLAEFDALPFRGAIFGLAINLPWFLIGAYYPSLLVWSSRFGWTKIAAVLGFYVALLLLIEVSQDHVRVFVWLAASAIGCSLGIMVSSAISRQSTRLAQLLEYLGHRTLAIYVLHIPLLALWDHFSKFWFPSSVLTDKPIALSYLWVLAGLIIAMSVILERAVRSVAPFLLRSPRFISGLNKNPSRSP